MTFSLQSSTTKAQTAWEMTRKHVILRVIALHGQYTCDPPTMEESWLQMLSSVLSSAVGGCCCPARESREDY
jgi:hypothetical protein